MRDAEAVTFAGGTLDRAAHLRSDAASISALASDERARFLPVWRGRPLVESSELAGLGWLSPGAAVFSDEGGAPIFLGLTADGAPRFARELDRWSGPDVTEAGPGHSDPTVVPHPDVPETLGFADLRAVMHALDPADAGVAAAAKGLLAWHETHRFCARCGSPTAIADAGWKRVCETCAGQHFPRTDPVVIMLVTHGDDILLGRSAAWPAGMYSLLAGFMEPGESIEAAVRREVWEEAGVVVGAVDYLSSQPWPFPASLMIGCHGHALTRDIRRDPAELEDARWVSRQGALAGIAGHDPDIRPARKGSIARFLIERWLADRLG
jgi:NAD+ diphosphatase